MGTKRAILLIPALLILAFSGCLLSFQLALGRHFRHSGSLAPPMRGLVVLCLLVWAAGVAQLGWHGVAPAKLTLPAVCLLTLSAALFAVTLSATPSKVLPAAFANEAPAFVINGGPYRFVRHPFYVAYMLYWAALALAAPHPLVVSGALLIVWAYVFLARREERLLLAGPRGPDYERYIRSTGRFLPPLANR